MPGTSNTPMNTTTAANPNHNMKAPGASASAANSSSAAAPHAKTSQRISASRARRGGRRNARGRSTAKRFLGQFGDAGERTDHATCFHRHQHELLVRAFGQRLERLDVFLCDEVIDRLHVAISDRIRYEFSRLGLGACEALARFGLAEGGFAIAFGFQDGCLLL